jgi:hypothetical protein
MNGAHPMVYDEDTDGIVRCRPQAASQHVR